ncbi:MAG: FAD-dependent oxidoreductase, partial [Alphaproteobacteria bacterium]
MTIRVAIIGSGPSGFYTADALLKGDRDVEIDIIERLPTPFGLIRGGVAPDHQTTKKVARAYEKTALTDSVAYFGNVEVGRDVSMDEMREMYDAVVLAIGAPADRKLGIPGEDKAGVFGSSDFVGWY